MPYFEKRLVEILEAVGLPEIPTKAPPKPHTTPSRPKERPEESPWSVPRPKHQPQPKNVEPKRTIAPPIPRTTPSKPRERPAPTPWHPPRPKHQPQPKNFGGPRLISQFILEAYEDEVEPSTQSFWKDLSRNPAHTLGKHPIFAIYGDDLSRTSWAHTSERARAAGVDINALMHNMQQIMQIEQPHREKLVNLAKQITCKIWGIPEEMLRGELTQDVEVNEEENEDEDEEVDDETRKHVNKRLTMNAMTHGSAVHAMLSMHYLIDKEIEKIDPRLLQLYNKISSGAHNQYWLINIPRMLAMLGAMAVGSAKVDWDEEEPRIDARGVIFPVLAQEMSKGVAELLSHHGLADLDEPTTKTVLKHADDIKNEPYLMQVGPEIWRRFLKAKPRELPLADIYVALAKQSPDDLHKIITVVVEEPEQASELLNDLLAEPESFDIDEYNPENESFNSDYEEDYESGRD